MSKKAGKRKLFQVLLLLTVVPLVLSVAFVSFTSIYLTKSNLESKAQETLYVVANNLANHCSQNKVSYATAETYHDYIDGLTDKNIEMAILIDGSPSVASIKNENGYRIREITIKEEYLTNRAEHSDGYYDDHVVIDNKVYYAYYMPITVNNEYVGFAFAGELEEQVTGATREIIFTFIGAAAVLLIIFAVITIIFSRKLTLSFGVIHKQIGELSKGDLSQQKAMSHSVHEINDLMQATTLLQQNLAKTIGNVKQVSDHLVKNIAEVTELSENSSEGANQITISIQELTKSVLVMDENVQDINLQMQEIGTCINDISEHIEQLYQNSDVILRVKDEAELHMDSIKENSLKSVEAVNEIATQIGETNSSIKDIDQAVGLIIAIAEQTNLLSLNASIEAARAGELGRGFSVIAEEIRSLSSQSNEGAEMIQNLSHSINEKSQKSVKLADEVHSLILEEQNGILQTQSKYEELSQKINHSVEAIKSIAEKTDKLNEYKINVTDKVQELSAVSEENAAGNETVSRNIDKINLDVRTVNKNCEGMNVMAQKLEESISYFHSGDGIIGESETGE